MTCLSLLAMLPPGYVSLQKAIESACASPETHLGGAEQHLAQQLGSYACYNSPMRIRLSLSFVIIVGVLLLAVACGGGEVPEGPLNPAVFGRRAPRFIVCCRLVRRPRSQRRGVPPGADDQAHNEEKPHYSPHLSQGFVTVQRLSSILV